MVYMQQQHFQPVSRLDIYEMTCEILLRLFWIYEHHMKFNTVPVGLHDVKNAVNQKALSSKHVSIIFYREKYNVILNNATATLMVLFAWRGSDYGTS